MHRKTILYVRDKMAAADAFSHVVASIDANLEMCPAREMEERLSRVDLVVCHVDITRASDLSPLEKSLEDAGEVPALLVADDDALSALRLPAHVPCDFVLPGASEEEIRVRLRHLLWPGEETNSSDFISIDGMTINLATYQVHVNGTPVDFTYLEYALLAFLVTHPGHVYPRDLLLQRVWGFDYYGGSRTVDVHVRRVRAKLGGELATHLVTVRGVGYMWE